MSQETHMLSSRASSIPLSWVPYSSRNWPYVRNWTSPAISKDIKKCLSQPISDILSKHLSSGKWTYNCCHKFKNIRGTKLWFYFFFLNTLNELCTLVSCYTVTRIHSLTKPCRFTSFKHTLKYGPSPPLHVSVHPYHPQGVHTPNLKPAKIQLITSAIFIICSIQQLNLTVQSGSCIQTWVQNISKVLHIIVIYVVWCKQFVYTRRLIF